MCYDSTVVTAPPVLPSEQALVVATQRQVACNVGDEAVLLQIDQGIYYGLNPVAARVWQLLQTPQAIATVVSQVEREFEVEHERCSHDVRELVAKLAQARLVLVTEAGAT
jgi:Coenzyme PQQ synthesis protein D (PqqD)